MRSREEREYRWRLAQKQQQQKKKEINARDGIHLSRVNDEAT